MDSFGQSGAAQKIHRVIRAVSRMHLEAYDFAAVHIEDQVQTKPLAHDPDGEGSKLPGRTTVHLSQESYLLGVGEPSTSGNGGNLRVRPRRAGGAKTSPQRATVRNVEFVDERLHSGGSVQDRRARVRTDLLKKKSMRLARMDRFELNKAFSKNGR
jgi:hypothetical protein